MAKRVGVEVMKALRSGGASAAAGVLEVAAAGGVCSLEVAAVSSVWRLGEPS
jgi:hypothetical protein